MRDVAGQKTLVKNTVWTRLRARPAFWLAAALLALFAWMAIAPAVFVAASPATHDPHDCSLRDERGRFQDRERPSARHWFGTDLEGCDYYARVVYAARTSIVVGISAVLVGGTAAVVLGAIAGYYGGIIDGAISRATDIVFGVPFLIGAILLLTFVAGSRHSPLTVGLILGLLGWPLATRILRASVAQVRTAPYVAATRTIGASDARIIVRHILPNAVSPLLSYGALSIGVAIATEAGLTFLGIGVTAPTISWGLMIDAAEQRLGDVPYLLLFPCLFLSVLVVAFVLLGQVLSDALDPRRP